jgi:ABC-2 type transport system permease protein
VTPYCPTLATTASRFLASISSPKSGLLTKGVGLGILASTFARNEFQVLQFIPIVIPQGLLSGMIWPVAEMPAYLQPLAYAMPLTYANRALRDIMLKGQGIGAIWPNVLILLAFAVVFVALGALTVRREVA